MASRDHPLCRASSLPMGHRDQGRVFLSWTVSHVSPTAAKLNAGRAWGGARGVVFCGKTAIRPASPPVWPVIPCGSFRCARSRNAGPL